MTNIIAHRGYRETNLPENSIPAFREAVKKGASGFEFDIHLTSDNKLLCHHDANINDEQKSIIKETPLEKLRQYKLGDEVILPTLDEIFTEFGNKTLMNLEVKADNAAKWIVEEIERYSIDLSPDNLIISSFKENPLREIKELNPKIQTALLYVNMTSKIKLARSLKCDALHPYYGNIPVYGVERFHKYMAKKHLNKGKKMQFIINPWTVNSPYLIKELMKMNIDGVITDKVSIAIKIQKELSE